MNYYTLQKAQTNVERAWNKFRHTSALLHSESKVDLFANRLNKLYNTEKYDIHYTATSSNVFYGSSRMLMNKTVNNDVSL